MKTVTIASGWPIVRGATTTQDGTHKVSRYKLEGLGVGRAFRLDKYGSTLPLLFFL